MGDQINIAITSSPHDKVNGINIPDEPMVLLCEGIPRPLWMGRCVVLKRANRVPMAKGICCNFVIGFISPLGDSHVVLQISSSLSMALVPDDWRYSIRVWPIEFVYYNGANFQDHEL